MISGDIYSLPPVPMGPVTKSFARKMRADFAIDEAWSALEELERAETVREAQAYERARRLKGGLAAFAVSALGVAMFVGLCLVWGKR